MIAFLRSCRSSKNCISISRVLLYSTETSIIKPPKASKNNNNLYRRILPFGNPNASMFPIIDQWEKEGKFVSFRQLSVIIKNLRKFNRYGHALQLSEWMANIKGNLPPAGVAVHLDLIFRAQGLEQAENYFNTIPDDVKSVQVYGALLNCYSTTKSVEKAEATAEKMKQMGMMTTLSYNAMLNLYKRTKNNKKLDKIYQEMIELDVPCNNLTYHIRLSAYASTSDLNKMEKVLKNMEDWNAYVTASEGYIKSGLHDKAFEMLKKSEDYIRGNSKRVAWETLIPIYSTLGKKDDVYRIWNLYKTSCGKVYNHGYSCIIGALVKLDDIEGAEKVLTEWESKKLYFDFRIPNFLLRAYCLKGILGKAEEYVARVVDMGKEVPASTWGLFVGAYLRENRVAEAAEMVKKGVAAKDKRRWKVDDGDLKACVEYLKETGELGVAEEIESVFGVLGDEMEESDARAA